MRTLLSVKWKLILLVIGISFVSLLGLLLLNLREARQFMQNGSRALLQEAAGLEASRYNQAAENIATISGAVNAAIHAELDLAGRTDSDPDPDRVANFVRSTLDNSNKFLKGLGVALEPGVFPESPINAPYIDKQGYTLIKYSTSSGEVAYFASAELHEVLQSDWWKEVKAQDTMIIAEPYLDQHVLPTGTHTHVETRFVLSVRRDGKFIGAIWAEMCLTDFQETLAKEEGSNRIGEAVLVSPRGATIGRPTGIDVSEVIKPSSTGLSSVEASRHPEIMEAVRNSKPLYQAIDFDKDQGRVQVMTSPILRRDLEHLWAVIVFRTEASALAGYDDTLARLFRQGLVMLLVSGLLGWVAAKFMNRSFLRNEQWHRTILDRVPLPLGILDVNSVWVYVNPAIDAALKSMNPNGMAGRPAADTMPPKDAQFILSTNRPEAADIEKMEVVNGGRSFDVSSCRLVDTDGEYIGRLAIGVDVTDNKNINRTLTVATTIARSLDAKSERIMSAARSLSDSAMQKSAAIEEITSTTEKIGQSSTTYATSARNSYSQAEATHQASDRGANEAQEVAHAMTGVRDSGQKVRSIIKLIDDIAFQTNLLSLNAAVEAARAGRNGKGFAVVAEEVRSLAGRSAKAAKETSAMIEEMADRIDDATHSIERLGTTLVDIRTTSENLRANSNEVARLADEQSHSVKQVHVSLEQISKSVNSTIVVSQETATVAESIMQQAAALRQVTEMGDENYRVNLAVDDAPRKDGAPISRIQLGGASPRRLKLPYEEHEERR